MNRNPIAVSFLAGILFACALTWVTVACAAQDGGYITLGLGYEPHDYFSRISRQGNPASVIRLGWCEAVVCLGYEHHSSAILGGAQSERETDTINLLFRYGIRRFSFEAGPAIDRNQHLGGRYAAIARIRYHLASRYFLDYEHIKGKDAHVNLFSIVATWYPFTPAH